MGGKEHRQGPRNPEADKWGRKPKVQNNAEPLKQFCRAGGEEGGKQVFPDKVSVVSSFPIGEKPCCKNALQRAKEEVAREEGYGSWEQRRDAEAGALEAIEQWAEQPIKLRKLRGLAEGKLKPTLEDVASVFVAMDSTGEKNVAVYLKAVLLEMAKSDTMAGKVARDCLSVPKA